MKTFDELLRNLNACVDAQIWARGRTIEQVVAECPRGDWLLWLARKVDVGLQPLTLVKGHCANTVRHLMQEEQSVKAVDTAIAFGEGRATWEELTAAAAAAAFVTANAATYATTANIAAANAANAAVAAASYGTTAADAAVAAASVRNVVGNVAAAHIQNQNQTAAICREHIGQLIIDKVNKLLKN